MPKKRHVTITMKDKKYTATACGFDFKDGVAKAKLVVDTPGRDTVALENVKSLFAGTTVQLGEYVAAAEAEAPKEEKKADEKKADEKKADGKGGK